MDTSASPGRATAAPRLFLSTLIVLFSAHVVGAACPTAPLGFLTTLTAADRSSDILRVSFANSTAASSPRFWLLTADALCIPHAALVVADVRPAASLALMRINCSLTQTPSRSSPQTPCDAAARVAYALYLSRSGALRPIGVASISTATGHAPPQAGPMPPESTAPNAAQLESVGTSPAPGPSATGGVNAEQSHSGDPLVAVLIVAVVLIVALGVAITVSAMRLLFADPAPGSPATPTFSGAVRAEPSATSSCDRQRPSIVNIDCGGAIRETPTGGCAAVEVEHCSFGSLPSSRCATPKLTGAPHRDMFGYAIDL